jgi:hypothetical protein
MKKTIVFALAAALVVFLGNGFINNHLALRQIDFVNIGDPASETGHNLEGWGPIEPQTNGGNWGQIASEATSTDCQLAVGENCDAACRVVYSGNNPTEPDHPSLVGRSAYLVLNKHDNGWGPKKVSLRVLDGVANDDFIVFIKDNKNQWVEAYEYISDPSTTEEWKVHEFALPINTWANKPIEMKILATGNNWSLFDSYGQLGIDWVKLYGFGK